MGVEALAYVVASVPVSFADSFSERPLLQRLTCFFSLVPEFFLPQTLVPGFLASAANAFSDC